MLRIAVTLSVVLLLTGCSKGDGWLVWTEHDEGVFAAVEEPIFFEDIAPLPEPIPMDFTDVEFVFENFIELEDYDGKD